MSNEISKYIFYYLLVHIFVLFIYGFFGYIVVCNGDTLSCSFDVEKIQNMLKTTASIFTPVIAIFAYFSWINQKKYDLRKEYLTIAIKQLTLIMNDIVKIRSNLHTIYSVDEKLVLYPNLIKNQFENYQQNMFDFYSALNAYKSISGINLLSDYDDFEQRFFWIIELNQRVISLYRRYFELAQKIDEEEYCSRNYKNEAEKKDLNVYIKKLNEYTKEKINCKDRNGIGLKLNYFEEIDKFIHKKQPEYLDKCLNELKSIK